MSVIRFDPNTPVEIALKYDAGRQVKSRIENAPDQMMYTICGDDTIYVPLLVAEKITQLGIKKLELISICKRQQGTMVKWEVKRIGDTATAAIPTAIDATPLERQLTDSINQVQQRQASTPSKVAPTAVATAPDPAAGTRNPAPQSNSSSPINHTIISRIMASALCAAIDATRDAEGYAHSKGIEIEFGSDDIRAISNTLFIALSKDPRFAPQPGDAGGAQPWRQ